MLDSLVNRGLAVAALAAAVLAFGFWQDGKAKATRIADLEGRVLEQNGSLAAFGVLAEERPRIERQYRNVLAAIDAAGERTSDACLTDPRVRAFYDGFRVRHPDSADYP